MKVKKILPLLAVSMFVLCGAKAQSTVSFEYGRKYAGFENTGIYLYDFRYFKDQNKFTNFYSFNYQVGLFSNFKFETGITNQFSTYDLGIELDNLEPPTFRDFYRGQISSWGIPFKIYYRLTLNKKISIDPSVGFTFFFNDFNHNINGSSYSETNYTIGKDKYQMVSIPVEKVQENIVIIPNLSARLNFNIFDRFDLYLKPDLYVGAKTMHQVDYTVIFAKNEEIERYDGCLINKGTSFNISFGLSYTFKRERSEKIP